MGQSTAARPLGSDVNLLGNVCIQLQDALNRTDGETPPPDFVTGDYAVEFGTRIESLWATLQCS